MLLGGPAMQLSFAADRQPKADGSMPAASAASTGANVLEPSVAPSNFSIAPAKIGAGFKTPDAPHSRQDGADSNDAKDEPKEHAANTKTVGVQVSPQARESTNESIGSSTKDVNEIDTSITVESHRLGERRDELRDNKKSFKIRSPESPHSRQLASPGGRSRSEHRNTLGLAVSPRDVTNGQSIEKSKLQASQRLPTTTASKPGGLLPPDEGFRQPPVARSIQPLIRNSLNRGAIDGSVLVRPSLAPSRVRGPAKLAGEINGTTFRLKHP